MTDRLLLAASDLVIIARHTSHVRAGHQGGRCWIWTGAISSKGTGESHLPPLLACIDRPRPASPGAYDRRATFVATCHGLHTLRRWD